jgi:uncharacterized protein
MAAGQELARRVRLVAANPTADVPSPCVSVCRMDAATGLCEGCFRTLDEIGSWSALDAAGRRAVWKRIGERALTPTLSRRERE